MIFQAYFAERSYLVTIWNWAIIGSELFFSYRIDFKLRQIFTTCLYAIWFLKHAFVSMHGWWNFLVYSVFISFFILLLIMPHIAHKKTVFQIFYHCDKKNEVLSYVNCFPFDIPKKTLLHQIVIPIWCSLFFIFKDKLLEGCK